MKNYKNRIVVDPDVLTGKPIIAGTRIPVELVLKLLAQGMDMQEIIKEYPRLKKEDIQAVLSYTLGIIENEEVYPLTRV